MPQLRAVRPVRLQRPHQWAAYIDYWEALDVPEKRYINQFHREAFGTLYKKDGSDWFYADDETRKALSRASNARRRDALTFPTMAGKVISLETRFKLKRGAEAGGECYNWEPRPAPESDAPTPISELDVIEWLDDVREPLGKHTEEPTTLTYHNLAYFRRKPPRPRPSRTDPHQTLFPFLTPLGPRFIVHAMAPVTLSSFGRLTGMAYHQKKAPKRRAPRQLTIPKKWLK